MSMLATKSAHCEHENFAVNAAAGTALSHLERYAALPSMHESLEPLAAHDMQKGIMNSDSTQALVMASLHAAEARSTQGEQTSMGGIEVNTWCIEEVSHVEEAK
jgi:hypothetical protein